VKTQGRPLAWPWAPLASGRGARRMSLLGCLQKIAQRRLVANSIQTGGGLFLTPAGTPSLFVKGTLPPDIALLSVISLFSLSSRGQRLCFEPAPRCPDSDTTPRSTSPGHRRSTDVIAAATWASLPALPPSTLSRSGSTPSLPSSFSVAAIPSPHRGLICYVLGARVWLLPIEFVMLGPSLLVWICALLDRSHKDEWFVFRLSVTRTYQVEICSMDLRCLYLLCLCSVSRISDLGYI
jgi:hypothetical protein